MTLKNKFGLPRTIPESVKRKIRKDAGFGCVICGAAICEYEHVDPEWAIAEVHNPRFMTLLCGSCHSKKTRGIIGIDKVKEAMKNPFCRQKGYTSDWLDFGRTKPIIQLGNSTFYNTLSLITINNESLFTILPADSNVKNGPYRLFALFHDPEENEVISIQDNIWYGNSENWDIESKGKRIIIRKGIGEIILDIENIPNERIIIHKMDMTYKNYRIFGNSKFIQIWTNNNNKLITINSGGKIHGRMAFDLQNNTMIIQHLKISDTTIILSDIVTLSAGAIIEKCSLFDEESWRNFNQSTSANL